MKMVLMFAVFSCNFDVLLSLKKSFRSRTSLLKQVQEWVKF